MPPPHNAPHHPHHGGGGWHHHWHGDYGYGYPYPYVVEYVEPDYYVPVTRYIAQDPGTTVRCAQTPIAGWPGLWRCSLGIVYSTALYFVDGGILYRRKDRSRVDIAGGLAQNPNDVPGILTRGEVWARISLGVLIGMSLGAAKASMEARGQL